MPGHRNPDAQQHRDGLFSITARRRATDRKLMAQEILQSGHNVVARVSRQDKCGRVFEPVKLETLTKANGYWCTHTPCLSMRMKGTTTSSRVTPPCPIIRWRGYGGLEGSDETLEAP